MTRVARVLAAWAAATSGVVGQQSETVSYAADVLPILQGACFGCHQPAKARGDVSLTSVEQLIDHELVVPSKPDDSPLIDVVTGTPDDPPAMPEEGKPLTDREVAVLRRWIEQGANDDSPAGRAAAIAPDRPPRYRRAPVVTSIDYSPDGELLAVTGYHEVLLHAADGSAIVARLVGLAERIESVAFSPDGQSLVAVGGSPGRFGEVQIWDVAKRELVMSRTVTSDCLFGASWSPDGKTIAFGCTDTTVRAIDATTGEQVLYQNAHDDWVLDTCFSTDGSHLVTVGRDRSMKLILVAAQQFIDNITSITPGALRGGLAAVDRRPAVDELLIGGADGVPKLYRMYREKDRKIGDDYNKIRFFEAMPGRVFAAEFSPNGSHAVVGSSAPNAGAIRVCAIDTGATAWTHATASGIYTAIFHPSGTTVAAAGFDGVVYVLDADSGMPIAEIAAVPLDTSEVPR